MLTYTIDFDFDVINFTQSSSNTALMPLDLALTICQVFVGQRNVYGPPGPRTRYELVGPSTRIAGGYSFPIKIVPRSTI